MEPRLQILPDGELVAHRIPVVDLISLAYGVPANPSPRLSGLPDWTAQQRFDIEARVPRSLELTSKDAEAQRRLMQPFLRSLLAERFGLVLQGRTERMPVYALSVAGGKVKLGRAGTSSKGCILDTGPEGCHGFAAGFGHPLNGRAVDMTDLAAYLENWTDLPVANCTGLAGLFAMHSQGWRPMTLPPPPPGSSGTGDEFARLPPLSAVLRGFGLELRRSADVLPVYTVKRIHPPDSR